MTMDEVRKLAEAWYGTMIKGTVDTELEKVALGGDYHIESCEMLVRNGSKHENVWGFNIRFEENPDGVLEFHSMVNLKPAVGNKKQTIENQAIADRCEDIIRQWIIFK